MELGPGKVSTLSFRTELHKLPPDFWSKVGQLERDWVKVLLGRESITAR